MSGEAVPVAPPSSCGLIELRRIDEPRGSLCVAEVGRQIPFHVQRAYWIFDVPDSGERGHHAHREQSELIVAVRGAVTVHCDEGEVRSTFRLDCPDAGLLLPPMVFHTLDRFASGSVCLVFASGHHDEREYVTDYGEFRELIARR